MNSAIKIISVFILTLFGSHAVAEESITSAKDKYGYIDFGVLLPPLQLFDRYIPIPVPQIGGGFRYQSGMNGVDTNLQIASICVATVIQGSVNWIFYPHPNVNHEFYLGIGPKISVEIVRHGELVFSPNFILGKQYHSPKGRPRHYQIEVMWPFIINHITYNSLFPAVSFSYAMGF